MSTSLTVDTSTIEEMLRARVTNIIVLPDGEITTEKEVDKAMVSSFKGVRLNMT